MKIKVPKMELARIDPVKIYNSLNIVDTTSNNFSTNYYILTPEQRSLVNALIIACENSITEQVELYNEDLGYFEEELNDN